MTDDVAPAQTLDCVGLYCPEPLFQTRESIDAIGIDALSGLEQRLWAVEPHAVERLRGGDVVGHVDSFGPWIPNHYGRYSPSVESKLIGDDPGPGGRPGRRRKVPRRHVPPGAVAAGFAGGGAKSIHSHGYGRAESHEALSDDGPRRRKNGDGEGRHQKAPRETPHVHT